MLFSFQGGVGVVRRGRLPQGYLQVQGGLRMALSPCLENLEGGEPALSSFPCNYKGATFRTRVLVVDREAWRGSPWGRKALDTTEQLN